MRPRRIKSIHWLPLFVLALGISVIGSGDETYPSIENADELETENAMIISELRRRNEAKDTPGMKSITGMETESTSDLIKELNDGQKAIYCAGNKVIYGCDDRTEIVDAPHDVRHLADAALIIVQRKNISPDGPNWKLNDRKFKANARVCDDEPFSNQPNPGRCSGFLIGPDLVATAGHCVNEDNIKDQFFVFDFAIKTNTANSAPISFSKNQVFLAEEIVGRQLNKPDKKDWAVVRLKRAPADRTPIVLSAAKTAKETELCVVGHPVGLPMKMACGASVRSNTHSQYFTAPLDTYGGNSGSLVFNKSTKKAEGILVRGDTDFVRHDTKNCFVSNICPNTGCNGEGVTRSKIVTDFMLGKN